MIMSNRKPIERLGSSAFHRGSSPIEVRASGQGTSRTIGGYAVVFNRSSENLGGFIEQVLPSFFRKSAGDGWPGVVCRFDHNSEFLLGSTRSGTLRLSMDTKGLDYSVDLPSCRDDVLEYAQHGDLGGSSFEFQCYEDEWQLSGDEGYPMRMLVSGRLIDVAPVIVPAYPDSTVGLRSLARHADAPVEDVRELAKANELRRLFARSDRRLSGRSALMEIQGKRWPDHPQQRRMSGRQAYVEMLARKEITDGVR